MRSLIRRRAKADPGLPRDPAPSRWTYRYQRMMLTPMIRAFVRIGLPAFVIVFIAGAWFSNEANRITLNQKVVALKSSIQERPEFMVTEMEVRGADAELAQAVAAIVQAELPLSSFEIDLVALRESVEEMPAVRAATARVRPGGVLEVAITQRVPVVVMRDWDGLMLVDQEGELTGQIKARADRADLPLVAGEGALTRIDEAMALFAAAEPLAPRLRGLVRMGERRWDLVLDRDQRILLPAADPVPALERVIALSDAQDMLGRDIAVVDMRNADQPTIRMNETAAAAFRGVPGQVAGAGN